MNALQEKELELLRIFVDIADKLGLAYYLVCGSALGAVKYGGFIPWDDDVDVALPRRDYEVFLREAPKMLPEWVFLQNHRTDRFYPGLGSKLRNSNTTFIEKEAVKIPMNHRIFIDVFPLDGYPSAPDEVRALERVKRNQYRRRYVRLIPFLHRDMGLTFNSLLYRLLGMFADTSEACRKTEEAISAYPAEGCEVWCNHANSMSKKEYAPASWYGAGTDVEFEGLRVKMPSEWDLYLSLKYGDYARDLPESEKVPSHGFIAYASSVVAFAVPVMQLGIRNTMIQELISAPERKGEILGTGLLMNFVSSLFCVVGVFCFAAVANPGDSTTVVVCVLYSFTLCFQAVEIVQYWFQERLMSKFVSVSMLFAYVVSALYQSVLLVSGGDVFWFAAAQSLQHFVIACALIFLHQRKGGQRLKVSLPLCSDLFSRSKHFVLSNLIITVFLQTDRVMLDFMLDSAAVGYYSAAVTCANMTNSYSLPL